MADAAKNAPKQGETQETETGAAPLNVTKPLVNDPNSPGDKVDAETLPVAERRVTGFQEAGGSSPLPPEAMEPNQPEKAPETTPVQVVALQRTYTIDGRLLEPGDISMYQLPKGEKLPGVFRKYEAPQAKGE